MSKVIALSILLILAPAASLAAEFLSKERGLTAATNYQMGDVDHVNLFNGNLSVTLPIGQQYPLGPSLGYGLVLTYNSNVWDYRPKECYDGINQVWIDYALPEPSARSNAGVGWELHLGRLFEPNQLPMNDGGEWIYISADGSQHAFYDELHPGAGAQANTLYTNDGSYLRMRHFSSGDTKCKPVEGDSGACRIIESPDGSVREFRNFGDWKLVRLRDAFGNWLDIDYSVNEWTLSDIHGRSHSVTFQDGNLSLVSLSGPDGTTADYVPSYTQTSIRRQGYTKPVCAPVSEGNAISVPLLTDLQQPDNTHWSMSYFTQWAFDTLSGGIEELLLPSGGKSGWTYQIYPFPSQSPKEIETAWMNNAQGVATRTIYWDPSNWNQKAVWTYDYKAIGNPPDPSFPAISCFHRQRVIDPVGNTTEYFFSTLRSSRHWAYGLPFTFCDPLTGSMASSGPFLSERWYEGEATSGNLKRSIWVEYTADGIAAGNGSDQESNARLVLRKEEFHDDGNRFREVLKSDFDGLGNFREMIIRGNFGLEKVARTEHYPAGKLLMNPETSLPLPGNTFVMPTGDIWLFGLSSATSITQRIDSTDPGTSSLSETCYSPQGFLLRSRILAGSTQQGHDLLRVFESETKGAPARATGFAAEVKLYGGDAAAEALGTGELCALNLPSDPEFHQKTSFSAGVGTRSAIVEPCDSEAEILQVFHSEIDAGTGAPLRSYDSAGFGTSFSYDEMGRLVREQPDQGAATLHLHTVTGPGVTTPAYQVELCDPTFGGADCPNDYRRLSSRNFYFDGLGRPTREAVAYPAQGNSEFEQSRSFSRDSAGRTTFESTWEKPLGTTYSGYDRFGRVSRIEPSGAAAVNYTYVGDRKVTREEKIGTGLDTTSSVFVTETYDQHGRLASVCENQQSAPSGDTCSGLLTTNTYDHADRLIEVCHVASGSSCGQRRKFDYDGRGFLLAEQQPEVGRTTADWTRFTYDTLGNMLTRDIDGDVDIPLHFRYDRAGRLTRIEENDGGLRPLKEFFYARENDESRGPFNKDWRAGKLFQARRHNWVQAVAPLPQAAGDVDGVVTDTYYFKGLGGAVSEKQTSLRLLSGTTAFRTGFGYDVLGKVSSITYPRCSDWPCYGNDPVRQVTFIRKMGYLTEIPGYASFNYQLGGSLLHHINFSNGITWKQQVDGATALPRPATISTSSAAGTELWSTGTYTYDGAGNIHGIGSLKYQYDGLGRLLKESQGVTTRQLATYDNFGNLTSLMTAGSSFTIPASPVTNRLLGAGTSYRADGSLSAITLGGEAIAYTYDGLGKLKYLQTPAEARVFFYDASDDRLLAWDCPTGSCGAVDRYLRWTVRGLKGEVLRAYDETQRDNRRWLEDFVYQNGRMIAATRRNSSGTEDRFAFALDHLASTRQVYDWSGNLVRSHSYYPFGQEVGAPDAADFVHKFTGHERDLISSDMSQLDYMHARYTSPILGRFLTVDPIGGFARQPSSLNRYSYVFNRPTTFTDPRGLFPWAEVYVDICLQKGLCYDDLVTVKSTYLPASRDLTLLFGYATFGREGIGSEGSSPPAEKFDVMAVLRDAKTNWLILPYFIWNSRTGGDWDPKRHCDQLDVKQPCQHFGNYVWGMLAAASGISLEVAQRGAGAYSALGPNAQDAWTWPMGSKWPLVDPPYGDDPIDSYWIRVGWLEYQKIQYEVPTNR